VPRGSRITALGGRSLAELDALALAYVPHENLYWARSEFARISVREDWISTLGLAAPDNGVEIVYESTPGVSARAVVQLSTLATKQRAPVGFALYPADSTGWFWMDRCDPDEDFLRKLDEFVVAVRRDKLRKVAIDLRGNPGGDVSAPLAVLRAFGFDVQRGFGVDVRVSKPLLASMPMFAPEAVAPAFAAAGVAAPATTADHYSIPAPLVLGMVMSRLGDRAFEAAHGVDLFLLTGGGTFSSASLFTALVRDNALGRIVGEPNGNSASFNGSEVILPVPGLPHELHLSTARLERADQTAGNAPAVLPDVLAPPTPQSVRDGLDPALAYVRSIPVPAQ
jgi:hypothetical protein